MRLLLIVTLLESSAMPYALSSITAALPAMMVKPSIVTPETLSPRMAIAVSLGAGPIVVLCTAAERTQVLGS